jgi:signal transduction histidine kinase
MGIRFRLSWVTDGVAIALILGAASTDPLFLQPRHAADIAVSALVAISAVVLPLRRRFPFHTLGVSLLCYVIAAGLGAPASAVVFGTSVVLFRIAAHTSRRVALVAASIVVGVMLAMGFVGGAGSTHVFDAEVIQSVLWVALAAAAGDATRSRRETIESITERAVRAEETRESEARRRVAIERLSIARDLHDAVAHQIAVISLNAGLASDALDKHPDAARASLSTIRVASREVLSEIGDLLQILRSKDDPGSSDNAYPQPGFDHLEDLVERFRRVGLHVELARQGDTSGFPGSVGIVAYRVIQEALTNAHKHGSADSARVSVNASPGAVRIDITNAIAERAWHGMATGGHGLVGMQERVESVRGSITTGTDRGRFRVSATLPIPDRDGA